MNLCHVLFVINGYAPSALINVITPLRYLQENHQITLAIALENEVTAQQLLLADILVLCRNAEFVYRPIYDLALQIGLPMIYDLDDDLQGVPEENYSSPYYNDPKRKTYQAWMMEIANLIHVHSPVLQQSVQRFNTNVKRMWAPVDWSLVPAELPVLTPDPVDIVYASQRDSGQRLLPLMEADLHDILRRYGNRVRLHFLGYNPPQFRGYPQVVMQPFEKDYKAYFSQFTRSGYAIGLAPMLTDQFHQSKTNIKFRDYAAAGAVGIYTDCPMYRDGVVDGETGLLVSGAPGSWASALERLLEDPALLSAIRLKARQFAEARYNAATVGDLWLESFRSLPKRLPLEASSEAEIASTTWWFTSGPKPASALSAWLRRSLRDVVPMRWKVAIINLQHALQKVRSGQIYR